MVELRSVHAGVDVDGQRVALGRRSRESVDTVGTVWLLRLGVRVIHGRPYTIRKRKGKEERFHLDTGGRGSSRSRVSRSQE